MGNPTQPQSSQSPPSSGFIALSAWIWLHRRTFVIITAAITILATTSLMLQPRKFSAQVTILPGTQAETPNLLGQVASFAGLSLGEENSLAQLYGQIIRSDRLLASTLDRDWPYHGHDAPVSLYEILGIADSKAEAGPRERHRLLRTLRNDVVSFFRDERTGYMILSVAVPRDPQLAADLANFLATKLEDIDRAIRLERADEHLDFVSSRLVEVQAGLDAAANALTTFLNENRAYTASPALLQRHGELEREVSAQTSIWIELRRQVELAEIDRHKESGVFTVLDAATPPLRKTSPKLATSLAIGIALGLFMSFVSLAATHLRRSVQAAIAGPAADPRG